MARCAVGTYRDGFPTSFRLPGVCCQSHCSILLGLENIWPSLTLKARGIILAGGTTAFTKKEDWYQAEHQPPCHISILEHDLSLIMLSSSHLLLLANRSPGWFTKMHLHRKVNNHMKSEQANVEASSPQEPCYLVCIPAWLPLLLFSKRYFSTRKYLGLGLLRCSSANSLCCGHLEFGCLCWSFQVAGCWHLLGLHPTSRGEGMGEHLHALVFTQRKHTTARHHAACSLLT